MENNINVQTSKAQRRRLWLLMLGLGIALTCIVLTLFWESLFAEPDPAATPSPAELEGVLTETFDGRVRERTILETQQLNDETRAQLSAIEAHLNTMNRERKDDQQRLTSLEADNKQLRTELEQTKALRDMLAGNAAPGANATLPAEQQVLGDIPPPNVAMQASMAGHGYVAPQTYITVQPPLPGRLDTVTFAQDTAQDTAPAFRYPYIPSGSFASALVIEGADANAAVTGPQNTSPMQLRLTGKIQMPNDHEYDLTGCFVSLEVHGDVSSERGIARTRLLSCKFGDDIIDQKIAGHVSFRGKNGIKGEVVMRNGQILGWAWGAGFVDGIGEGIKQAGTPVVGTGATASVSGSDIFRAGVGGGAGAAGKTLSEYYIKRAEQYHPIIPIGAGNEVTLVFQEGFQLTTLLEQRDASLAAAPDTAAPPAPPTLGQALNEARLQVGDYIDAGQYPSQGE